MSTTQRPDPPKVEFSQASPVTGSTLTDRGLAPERDRLGLDPALEDLHPTRALDEDPVARRVDRDAPSITLARQRPHHAERAGIDDRHRLGDCGNRVDPLSGGVEREVDAAARRRDRRQRRQRRQVVRDHPGTAGAVDAARRIVDDQLVRLIRRRKPPIHRGPAAVDVEGEEMDGRGLVVRLGVLHKCNDSAGCADRELVDDGVRQWQRNRASKAERVGIDDLDPGRGRADEHVASRRVDGRSRSGARYGDLSEDRVRRPVDDHDAAGGAAQGIHATACRIEEGGAHLPPKRDKRGRGGGCTRRDHAERDDGRDGKTQDARRCAESWSASRAHGPSGVGPDRWTVALSRTSALDPASVVRVWPIAGRFIGPADSRGDAGGGLRSRIRRRGGRGRWRGPDPDLRAERRGAAVAAVAVGEVDRAAVGEQRRRGRGGRGRCTRR